MPGLLPVLVDNDLEVLHQRRDVLQLQRCLLGLLLVAQLLVALGVAFAFYLLGLGLLLLAHLLVELVLQLVVILIAAVVQVIDGQEDLAQVEVLLAEIFVALLYLGLHVVLLLDLVFDLPRDFLDLVVEGQDLLVVLLLLCQGLALELLVAVLHGLALPDAVVIRLL